MNTISENKLGYLFASNVVEVARKKVIADLFDARVVSMCWPVWKPLITGAIGRDPTAASILELGAQLSEIFRSTSQPGRGQESVSGGGAAWEALVCYYLNLCLIGTNSIVFKKRSAVPLPIQEALTMSYRSVPANTESDMVAVTFPSAISELEMPLRNKESPFERLSQVADTYFHDLLVTVVQCKTNWNDNAQIPMMWDMLYNAKDFRDGRITQGINNRHLPNLKWFAYSFVTVPTNSLTTFKITSLSVRRVSELSGGNYWGRPDMPGVAKSVRQIFSGARIGPQDGLGLLKSLTAALPNLSTDYSYFRCCIEPADGAMAGAKIQAIPDLA